MANTIKNGLSIENLTLSFSLIVNNKLIISAHPVHSSDNRYLN